MVYSPFTDKISINVDVISNSSTVNSQLLITLTRQALVSFLDNGSSTSGGGAGGSAIQTNTDSNPLNWRRDIFETSDVINVPSNRNSLTRTLLLPLGTNIYGIARQDRVAGVLTIFYVD